jgi:hypothetical protein
MKTVWTILSVLAVANLIALGAFVGWLSGSDRIDLSRVRQIREVLTETVAQQKAREAEAAKKAEAEQSAAAEAAKAGRPPATAAELLEFKLEQSRLDEERQRAQRREIQLLRETLQRERAQLDADQATFKTEKEQFEQARKVVAESEGNAQFKKALATLEGLKPDKARATLQELLDRQQVDQVVSYLNAMQERTRTKVIDEFGKSDPKVATDLLERLRTRGQLARAPEVPPDVTKRP